MPSPTIELRVDRDSVALVLSASIAILIATGLTACAPATERCLPASLGASSTQVSPGESLTVESAAAGCELGYLNGATYSIVLISASGERSAAVEVPVERDGSFSAEILVPETFPTGEASALVSGSSYDECGDDPGSCAVYSVDVVIES
ncbi:hypothetical protein [Microbacterium foliorum]|uniref:hypothetical protein n=1 Tax=Microbacterium foliorum TaxID=104336 RepID=UPI003736FBD2